MTTLFSLLTVLLPIAACVLVPKWMKKNGKGKNAVIRILAGSGCAIALLIVFALLSTITMNDTSKTIDERTGTNVAEQTNQVKYPLSPKYEEFAYFKRDKKGDFNYRIFVFITDASPKDMEKHAKKQMWSKQGTTMVCYFRSSEGLDSDAITLAKDVDAAIGEVWKPTLVARYMHWPTGKEEFTENPYVE